DYFSFYMQHFEVPVYYFGTQYGISPWHYPLVLIFVTVPLVILIPCIIGIFTIGTPKNRPTHWYVLSNAMLPILLASLPGMPKYDGVRLFLPSFPFLCILSGIGLKHLYSILKKFPYGSVLLFGYLIVFVVSLYVSVFKTHPYQSSYFNEITGGLKGAVRRGFEAEYWGSAYLGLLHFMNRHADKVFWLSMMDIDPRLRFKFAVYIENGHLDKKIRFGNKTNSDYLILLIRQGFFNEDMWDYYRNRKPVFSVRLDGTALASIYKIK
ncbi:MAG: hypothetical protein JRJ85_09075, partial [Deltaproteobacteria bacterium]|nr:hypothetical protein [Deltaproteobacteria bacterium]